MVCTLIVRCIVIKNKLSASTLDSLKGISILQDKKTTLGNCKSVEILLRRYAGASLNGLSYLINQEFCKLLLLVHERSLETIMPRSSCWLSLCISQLLIYRHVRMRKYGDQTSQGNIETH